LGTTWAPELKPVTVVLGGFGSGKTEVAINCAVAWARAGRRITLVDLDTVTPAFRSRQAVEALEHAGVSLIAPGGALADADLPAVPGEVRAALGDYTRTMLVDAGGDPAGARAVSSLNDLAVCRAAVAWVVVNPWRPGTESPPAIALMIERLAESARLPVEGVVANLHLPVETDLQRIEHGFSTVVSGACLAGVAVMFCSVRRGLAVEVGDRLPPGTRLLELDLYMRPPWEAAAEQAATAATAATAGDGAVRERFSRGG